MVAIIGIVAILAGVVAILPRDEEAPANPVAGIATASAIAHQVESSATTPVATIAPVGTTLPAAGPLPDVNKPELVSPIGPLGYVEQLYTFADRDRTEQNTEQRVISISYLALTRQGPVSRADAAWHDW
ncbi:MAG TPA: hypothetical protein PKA95_17815, partial [Thermomicrobiales bacterium]|nr:hypothetical protein [Thermomicrobiales bacterium]